MSVTWYPRRELIVYIHDEQIKKYGGRMGFHRDPSLLDMIVRETRKYEGDIYQKAAFLLSKIIYTHVFKDGQHRTAFATTEMFLRKNGARIYYRDYKEAQRFLKEIGQYKIDEIAEWLRHGRHPGREETDRRDNEGT